MRSDGTLVPLDEANIEDLLVEQTYPEHSKKPETFVLSANGERYRNTRVQRRKARKAQRKSRRQNR